MFRRSFGPLPKSSLPRREDPQSERNTSCHSNELPMLLVRPYDFTNATNKAAVYGIAR